MPEIGPQSNSDADDPIDLLQRARAGDQTAVEELLARHLPLLKRWASGCLPRWARDITDTSDLVQETVLQTFKRLDAFEPRGEGVRPGRPRAQSGVRQ